MIFKNPVSEAINAIRPQYIDSICFSQGYNCIRLIFRKDMKELVINKVTDYSLWGKRKFLAGKLQDLIDEFDNGFLPGFILGGSHNNRRGLI